MKDFRDNFNYKIGKKIYSKKHLDVFEMTIQDMLNSDASIKLGDYSIETGENKTYKIVDYQWFTIKEYETFQGAWNFLINNI